METTGVGGDAGRAAITAANSSGRQILQRAVRAHGVVTLSTMALISIGFLALLGFASMACRAASLMAHLVEVSFFGQ